MQKRSNIHTISNTMNNTTNIAPPSYAEAVGLPTSTRNNPYVSDQPVLYDQGCSQMPSYLSSVAAPNYFYSNISNQPAYNPAYVSMPSQQNQPADTFYLASTTVIEPREENRKCQICKLFCKIILFVVLAFVFTAIVFNLSSKL